MRRLGILGLVAALALVSCTSRPAPLAIHQVPVPRLPYSDYDTRGAYPQFKNGREDLASVNAAIRDVILRDQHAALPVPFPLLPDYPRDRGTYEIATDPTLMSASSVVVSALLKSYFHNPGGEQDQYWVSFTIEVPSGRPVRISELFVDPTKALRVISTSVRATVLATSDCGALIAADPTFLAGFAPTAENYRDFALTERGLIIGLLVGGVACGRTQAAVSWRVVRPLLNDLGRRLVAGVRSPMN